MSVYRQGNAQYSDERGWVRPTLGQTQHFNMLCATCRKTSEHRRTVIHTGVGYTPHSVKVNTVMWYVRLATKHPSNDEGHSHRGWVPPTLNQTQHCNVLHIAYLKTSKQRQKVIHIWVGYSPCSVKLNTVMYYTQLTSKHPSNGEGHPHWGWGPPTLGQTLHYRDGHGIPNYNPCLSVVLFIPLDLSVCFCGFLGWRVHMSIIRTAKNPKIGKIGAKIHACL